MPQDKPRYVIIDTCIIQHADNEALATGIGRDLTEAYDAEFIPAVSHYTVFELLDGGYPSIEKKRMEAIAGIKQFRFQDRVIRVSARLACFYREYEIPDERIQKLKGDRIIAATCMLSSPNSIIYTTNAYDYPEPFFDVIAKRAIEYKKKNDAVMFTYFIKPDYNAIQAAFSQWKAKD